MRNLRWFDFPVTLAICATSVVLTVAWLAMDVAWIGWLTADAERIARGELWRLLTGPLIHATWGHLCRDLIIVLVIGAAYEGVLKPMMPALVVATLAMPTIVVLAGNPDYAGYYGTSGMSHGWIAAALTYEVVHRPVAKRWLLALVGAGFVAKIAYELAPGPSIIPSSLPSGIEPAPIAHLAGALAAMAVVALWERGMMSSCRTTTPSSCGSPS